MKKLIVGGLAALALGLVAAPVAGADANDDAFIEATDRVIYGGNAIDGDRWWGYPDVPAQIRIDAAKEACAMMDAGNTDGSKVNDYLVAALGPASTPDTSPPGSSKAPSLTTVHSTVTASGSSDGTNRDGGRC